MLPIVALICPFDVNMLNLRFTSCKLIFFCCKKITFFLFLSHPTNRILTITSLDLSSFPGFNFYCRPVKFHDIYAKALL